jgi:hypothetical protein
MFQCSKLPCLGWRSADFLQGFFRPKCLQEQLKQIRSSIKISMGTTLVLPTSSPFQLAVFMYLSLCAKLFPGEV